MDLDEAIRLECEGVMPNAQQRKFIEAIVRGDNIALMGPPGTGKTYVSNLAARVLARMRPGTRFARTATTGMASTHLEDKGGEGKTLFRFINSGPESMIGHTPAFLNKLLNHQPCRESLTNVDILQIDEASMLNIMTVSHVENAARSHRRNRSYMGGIKMILSGDIMQLGVIDVSAGPGMARAHELISIPGILDCLPDTYNVVMLTELMRSVDDPLHQEVIKGLVQRDSAVRVAAIKILNDVCLIEDSNPWTVVVRAANDGHIIITYSNNQVDLYNQLQGVHHRQQHPNGPIRISQARKIHSWESLPRMAKDILESEKGLELEENVIIDRRSFISSLSLYPGQICMLRRNTETYKNGQTVRFIRCIMNEDNDVLSLEVVRLSDNKTLFIEKIQHTSEYVPEVGYEQFPIIPNAAVTVHKVQGSTLHQAIFDPFALQWSGKDLPRLIYTAVSRTRSLKNFLLMNRIAPNLMEQPCVQEALDKLWSLDYMADYPTTTVANLERVYAEYKN